MSNFLEQYSCKARHNFEFGIVRFYEDFLITELKEGACFNINDAYKISKLIPDYFEDRPFGYISNRINSYAVTPTDYLKIKEVFPTINSLAAVIHSSMQKSVIEIENSFLENQILDFDNLEDAIKWTKLKLKEKNN